MKLSLFDYHLPEELIAQYPLNERDQSRLMVLDRHTHGIQHTKFSQLPEFLSSGDVVVLNNTKVIPARLIGRRERTGGKVEVLLLSPKGEGNWEALVKRSSRIEAGTKLIFGDGKLVAKVLDKTDKEERLIQFEHSDDLMGLLEQVGQPPLPPYIKREPGNDDKRRYQTIYAKKDGAVAAPTAGLHFTDAIFEKLKADNIKTLELTLHVGLGTFQPVRTENVEEHHLHSEFFEINQETAQQINQAKSSGGKIIAVGTTSVRALESSADENGNIHAKSGLTEIFIYPGYRFRAVDVVITNFHLPKSTLLMLVSAFAGREFIMRAYEEAVKEKYRFYSYGDAMLVY